MASVPTCPCIDRCAPHFDRPVRRQQCLARLLQEHLTMRSQPQKPPRTVRSNKLTANLPLQIAHLLTDRRLRHVQLPRSPLAAELGYRVKIP